MANKQGDFLWYELLTSDPDAAQAFYGPILGWTFSDSGQSGMDYRIISADDGQVGGLMAIPSGAPMPPCWLGYIAVEDVDAAAAAIRAAGGRLHMGPQDIPGIGRFALAADPHGAPFYVMRGSVDGTSTAFAPDRRGHCAWNELTTSDQDGALRFYSSLFGWEEGGAMPMGEMGDYQFVNHSGAMIGAIMTGQAGGPPPMWRFYFVVPGITAAAETVSRSGGRVLHGPAEVPGGDYILICTDPQGAEFGLVGPRE